MYNLNVNLATTAANAVNSLLSVDNSCTTPRTPEILNSLIAMTNPLDSYNFGEDVPRASVGPLTSMSSDSNSSSCSQLESPTNAPPSIQHTCSQLIKAGLKLSIEQKRKLQCDGDDLLDLDKCKRVKKSECSESEEDRINYPNGLTPEDEERRRRRRERNKIAATKCRLKKRERTANLVSESETLETQNVELKSQIQELQNQHRQLYDILAIHRRNCQRNIPSVTRDSLFVNASLPPVSSVIDGTYGQANEGSFENLYGDGAYSRSQVQFGKQPPEIIVESPDDEFSSSHLTNLDDPVVTSAAYQYNQCHNYTNANYCNSPGLDNGCMA